MKYFFLNKILKFTGGKLTGQRTKGAGLALIFTGLVGIIGNIFPDMVQTLVDLAPNFGEVFNMSVETAMGLIAGGWITFTGADKAERGINEIREIKSALQRQREAGGEQADNHR